MRKGNSWMTAGKSSSVRINTPFFSVQAWLRQNNIESRTACIFIIQLNNQIWLIIYFAAQAAMTIKKINGYSIFMKEVLGKGSYGSVYRGEQDGTKKECAIKILQKKLIDSDDYLKSALFSEIQILQLVKSINVVGVIDVMESNHNYYIIQELCDGDLQKFLQKSGELEQGEAIRILTDICNGFLCLVREGIVHRQTQFDCRDLKPANIMLSKGTAKIGDFGFAKKNSSKRMKNASSVGTPLYMSLEILKSEPYTSKCDIWAAGFIFYQMLHGRPPWTANTEFQLVKNIQNKPLVINPNLTQNSKNFLRNCLQLQEKNRISWDEVFVHHIFKGYFKQYAQQNEQFEDKLKMVMTQLRFKINANNIDLNKLLNNMGFTKNHELSLKEFHQFLKHIHPTISRDEVNFFFEKMDKDEGGTISLSELSAEMEKHHINFNNKGGSQDLIQNLLSFKKVNSLDLESFGKKMSSQLQLKVKKCFVKLYKILTLKKLTLYKTFLAYDSDKSGELRLEEFSKILKRLDGSFTEDEIYSVFGYIDQDHSKTVEFDELNSYYCKVNGIPQNWDLPPEYYQFKHGKNMK